MKKLVSFLMDGKLVRLIKLIASNEKVSFSSVIEEAVISYTITYYGHEVHLKKTHRLLIFDICNFILRKAAYMECKSINIHKNEDKITFSFIKNNSNNWIDSDLDLHLTGDLFCDICSRFENMIGKKDYMIIVSGDKKFSISEIKRYEDCLCINKIEVLNK